MTQDFLSSVFKSFFINIFFKKSPRECGIIRGFQLVLPGLICEKVEKQRITHIDTFYVDSILVIKNNSGVKNILIIKYILS